MKVAKRMTTVAMYHAFDELTNYVQEDILTNNPYTLRITKSN